MTTAERGGEEGRGRGVSQMGILYTQRFCLCGKILNVTVEKRAILYFNSRDRTVTFINTITREVVECNSSV